MPNESSIAVGSVVDGRYALERSLGKGGMGEVFLARERAVERIVALKLLRRRALSTPAARERFYREARTLGSLNHDNIVRLYAAGEHKGMPYIVTELIAGMAVDRLLSRAGRLDWTMATHIANQTAAALSIAHAKDILHRDVKPANLIIGDLNDEQGHVWLLDFGIALPRLDHKVTQGDDVVGTPLFMSPEQAAGEPVDVRTDIYSLGVTLFWLLTGRPPFATHERAGVELEQILDAHLDEEPRLLRDFCIDFPDDLEVIVGRCLAKDPADRFANVEELQRAFLGLFRTSLPPDHPLAFVVMRSRFLQERKEALASGRPHELTAISRMWQAPESGAAASEPAAPAPLAAAEPPAAPPPTAMVAAPAESAPGPAAAAAVALATTGRAPSVIAPQRYRAVVPTANDARFYPVAETVRLPKRPRLGPEGTALMAPRTAGTAPEAPREPPREARDTVELAAPMPLEAALPFRTAAPTAVVAKASARPTAPVPSVQVSWGDPNAGEENEPLQENSRGRRLLHWGPLVGFALGMLALGALVAFLALSALAPPPEAQALSPLPTPAPSLVAAPSAEPSSTPAAPSASAPASSTTTPAPAPRPRPPPREESRQPVFGSDRLLFDEDDNAPPKAPSKPAKKPTPPDPF